MIDSFTDEELEAMMEASDSFSDLEQKLLNTAFRLLVSNESAYSDGYNNGYSSGANAYPQVSAS